MMESHMEDATMHIRSTTDPITLLDVTDPDQHPCIYEGDGDNGFEVYFENEDNRQLFLELEVEDYPKIVKGNDSEDYVAEG